MGWALLGQLQQALITIILIKLYYIDQSSTFSFGLGFSPYECSGSFPLRPLFVNGNVNIEVLVQRKKKKKEEEEEESFAKIKRFTEFFFLVSRID